MTVTSQLPPDIESALVAQAQAQGLDLTQYVQNLLREQVPSQSGGALSPAQRAEAWRQAARGLLHSLPLSDEAISRESIYRDRGK